MSKKKNSLLVKRPQPPAFSEIIEDIESTDSQDVVFSFSSTILNPNVDANVQSNVTDPHKSVVMTTGGETSKTSDVESSYRRAVEFIESVSRLKAVPEELRERYERVKGEALELCQTVEAMRRQADEIKTFALSQEQEGKSCELSGSTGDKLVRNVR